MEAPVVICRTIYRAEAAMFKVPVRCSAGCGRGRAAGN